MSDVEPVSPIDDVKDYPISFTAKNYVTQNMPDQASDNQISHSQDPSLLSDTLFDDISGIQGTQAADESMTGYSKKQAETNCSKN